MLRVLMCAALQFVMAIAVEAADELREVRGRVLDESGRPVADADVSYFWSANGSGRDAHGQLQPAHSL